jgi:hypothetical protein
MNRYLLIISVLLVVSLVTSACSLQIIEVFVSPTATPTLPAPTNTPLPPPQPTPTPTQAPEPTPEPTPTVVIVEDCTSPVEPGNWAGSVLLSSTATGMGFRVVQQSAALPLILEVHCDGSITGTATRTGEAEINVPFMLNGECTDLVDYDVVGRALGRVDRPTLELEMIPTQGTMACQMSSRVSSVPSGNQIVDITGRRSGVTVTADEASEDHLAGSRWPDRLYQETLPELDAFIEDAGLTVQNESAWRLERQGSP